jgi:hypothetical protein
MTFKYNNVYINETSTVVGPYEYKGPLSKYFDTHYEDLYFGEKTWEQAEIKMIIDSTDILLKKLNKTNKEIDVHIGSDLLNQIVATNYASSKIGIPLIGVYSACAASTLEMLLASNMIEASQVKNTIITDELKDMVINSITKNPTVESLDMTYHRRFNIGGVVVIIRNDGTLMSYLPDDFTSKHAVLWKADVGGVLMRELKKKDVLLYEHVSENFRVLLKKIREEELEDFKNRKLHHLTIGESDFCIIKAIKATDSMYVNNVKNERYIVDEPIVNEDEDSIYYIEESKLEKIDETTQYSLF